MDRCFPVLQTTLSCCKQSKVRLGSWVPSDVPKGTFLCTLLFSLYINDISTDIESEIMLFVNDCVCYREIKENDCLDISVGRASIFGSGGLRFKSRPHHTEGVKNVTSSSIADARIKRGCAKKIE